MDTRTARPSLPAVHRVLEWPGVQKLCENYGKAAVTDAVRHVLAEARAQGVAPDDLGVELSAYLERWARPSLRRVFNLTGTVLHTNLGRARLPEEAIEAMAHAARTPCNLEFDVERGRRGQRDAHIETLICELTGAEAATFVNNNAASVLLILNTLALGREVPISRGELIEIGGAFRMPDIMAQAGCLLREVGTTNRTHLKDFAAATSADTGCILTVHPSNYEVVGFTKTVSLPELAELARTRDLPLVSDLGSGSLVDLERLGLPREMTVSEVLSAGADLVCFSGDKLLGGPQAGIIAGKASLIAELNRNPMKRAMRLDKVTIAALEAVLRLYRMPDRLVERLPTLAQLSRSADALQAQAERVLPAIRDALAPDYEVTIEPCKSQIGSGALPVAQLPSRAIAVRPIAKTGPSLNTLSARFLALPIPVIGRTHKGTFCWI